MEYSHVPTNILYCVNHYMENYMRVILQWKPITLCKLKSVYIDYDYRCHCCY